MIDRAYSFRRWLADRVLGTLWATRAISDSEIDAIARQLGLDPEFLLEVRAEAKLEKQRLGLPVPSDKWHIGPRENRRGYQFHLFMPEAIHKAWNEECGFRQIHGHLLLRSLLHDYLLGDREPCPLRMWRWKGNFYKMGTNEKRKQFLERTSVPQGARRALTIRATRIGATPTSVARALVVEVLSGLHVDVPLVETGMMFDDERRYLARFKAPA